jgi:hypothetical protein
MARWVLPEMSPWKRRPLTIPPDSLHAWMRLAVWEFWMGILLTAALIFGIELFVSAPRGIVTVFDFTNCYAVPPIMQPCERVVYRAGAMSVAFNVWCGLLMIAVSAWLLWELWTAVAPKPITDDFLRLLDDSFGKNWRSVRTWPWMRIGWAYGFTLVGAAAALAVALFLSTATASSEFAKTPVPHVETSQRFRQVKPSGF